MEFTDDLEGARVSPLVFDEDFRLVAFARPRGRDLVAEGLPVGRYFVDVRVGDAASVLQPVEVRAGETSWVRPRVQAGVMRNIICVLPDGVPWQRLRATIRAEDGALRHGALLERRPDGSTSLAATLPRGRFTVEARTDTDLTGRTTFVVEELEPQRAPLVVELR